MAVQECKFAVVAITRNMQKDIIKMTRRGVPTTDPNWPYLWDDEDDADEFMNKARRCFSHAVYPTMYVEKIPL